MSYSSSYNSPGRHSNYFLALLYFLHSMNSAIGMHSSEGNAYYVGHCLLHLLLHKIIPLRRCLGHSKQLSYDAPVHFKHVC